MFYSTWIYFKEFFTTFAPALGLEFAGGLPFMATFVFLGTFGEPEPIAIFGLMNFFHNILIFPVGFSIVEVSGVLFAKRHGEKNYYEMAKDVYRTMLTFVIFLMVFYFMAFFSGDIFMAANVEPEIAKKTSRLILLALPISTMLLINRQNQAFLSSLGFVQDFMYPNIFAITVGIAASWFFIVHCEMRHMGFLPARAIQEIISFAIGSYLFVKKADRRALRMPPLNEILTGYGRFVIKMAYSAVGTVAEWATFEINTFLAVQLHDLDQLAIFLDWTGISPVFYMIGFGASSTMRIIIGKIMGQGNFEQARQLLVASLFYVSLLSLVFSAILYLSSHKLAYLYVQNPLIAEPLSTTIVILSLSVWGYLMFYPVFQVFRLIDEELFFIIILLTYFVISNTFIGWLLGFVMEMKTIGLVIAHGFATFSVQLIFLYKIFYLHDWTKDEAHMKEILISEDMELRSKLSAPRATEDRAMFVLLGRNSN